LSSTVSRNGAPRNHRHSRARATIPQQSDCHRKRKMPPAKMRMPW
jgi:hypothetical protein